MPTTLDQQILKWLTVGDVGHSSQSIAFWLGYDVLPENNSHPIVPSEFHRCLKLIELAPELRPRLHKMASLSNEWAKVIEHWDAIEALFLEEAGLDWIKGKSAPRTTAYMKSLFLDQGACPRPNTLFE